MLIYLDGAPVYGSMGVPTFAGRYSSIDGEWQVVTRAVYANAAERMDYFKRLNGIYDAGNWRIVWAVEKGRLVGHGELFGAYERSFLEHLERNPDIVKLIKKVGRTSCMLLRGSGVYRDESTHREMQDAALAGAISLIGFSIGLADIERIRRDHSLAGLAGALSPAKVPFYDNSIILAPEAPGSWDRGSLESFYRSNMLLEVKRKRMMEIRLGAINQSGYRILRIV